GRGAGGPDPQRRGAAAPPDLAPCPLHRLGSCRRDPRQLEEILPAVPQGDAARVPPRARRDGGGAHHAGGGGARGRRAGFSCISLLVSLLAGIALPAQACAIRRPEPTREQVAAAQEPRFGLVGRILTTYIHEETARSDTAIVQVEVTKDFSGKLPPVIFV